ncbi:hypothetical protein ASJ33_01280 [Dehalococcoides mccartyi]|nr:hypothetical protein ASJ33_01280 [Dehalococcoides mccartyi]
MDIAFPQHGFINNGIFTTASKSGIFPDQNNIEGFLGVPGQGNHLTECWTCRSSAGLGFIHKFTHYFILVVFSILTDCFQLS